MRRLPRIHRATVSARARADRACRRGWCVAPAAASQCRDSPSPARGHGVRHWMLLAVYLGVACAGRVRGCVRSSNPLIATRQFLMSTCAHSTCPARLGASDWSPRNSAMRRPDLAGPTSGPSPRHATSLTPRTHSSLTTSASESPADSRSERSRGRARRTRRRGIPRVTSSAEHRGRVRGLESRGIGLQRLARHTSLVDTLGRHVHVLKQSRDGSGGVIYFS